MWSDGRMEVRTYVCTDGRTHPTSVSLLGHRQGNDLKIGTVIVYFACVQQLQCIYFGVTCIVRSQVDHNALQQ